MKISRSKLTNMIRESIEKCLINELGNTWNYPGDSDFSSGAPWNQSDSEVESEEKSESFPTIPFILLGVRDYVSDLDACLNLTRIGLSECPEQINISAEYKYNLKWDGPDEDGFGSQYKNNEERTSLGIYVNVNGKWYSFIDWAKQVYRNTNQQLFVWLKDAYDGLLDMLNDSTYTADEFDNTMSRLKSEVAQMQTLVQHMTSD